MSQTNPAIKLQKNIEEAFSIANGKKGLVPRRRHVVALVQVITGMQNKMHEIDRLVGTAYEAAKVRAVAKGEPIPPPPARLAPVPQ